MDVFTSSAVAVVADSCSSFPKYQWMHVVISDKGIKSAAVAVLLVLAVVVAVVVRRRRLSSDIVVIVDLTCERETRRGQ